MLLLWISFAISYAYGTCASYVHFNNLSNVLKRDCPTMPEGIVNVLVKDINSLYKEISSIWDGRYAEYADDFMIWNEVLGKQFSPSINDLVKRLQDRVSYLLRLPYIESECIETVDFMTNILRVLGRENFLLTKMDIEQCPWMKPNLSFIMQLQWRLRMIRMKNTHGIQLLDEQEMRQLEEFVLFGQRLSSASKGEEFLYEEFLVDFWETRLTLNMSMGHEIDILMRPLVQEDRELALSNLKAKDDLTVTNGSMHLKRTSSFFHAYYWITMYYRMIPLDARRFQLHASSFECQFEKYRKALFSIARGEYLGWNKELFAMQMNEMIILYNAFSCLGRYLGIKIDYYGPKNDLACILLLSDK